ncbi:DUF1450 domain-containing protein [Gracilibacillus sp. YIM 98692]|uniref:DUF1450 domain-containing protein n=1 Tax=Gracilibacillus sp. YIM 98692 TaxID=2663532 RepID=UPI0013D509A6|nr:DUF1450 domain-containing protein [Gracilibacillus sp. YIM 98692]
MTVKVNFCVKNLAKGTEKVKEELEKDPDIEVSEYGCTSFCGICRQYHVAIVNGRPVIADTPNELIEAVYDYIDNELFDES